MKTQRGPMARANFELLTKNLWGEANFYPPPPPPPPPLPPQTGIGLSIDKKFFATYFNGPFSPPTSRLHCLYEEVDYV